MASDNWARGPPNPAWGSSCCGESNMLRSVGTTMVRKWGPFAMVLAYAAASLAIAYAMVAGIRASLTPYSPSLGVVPENLPHARMNKHNFLLQPLALLPPNDPYTFRPKRTLAVPVWRETLHRPMPRTYTEAAWTGLDAMSKIKSFREDIQTAHHTFRDEAMQYAWPTYKDIRTAVLDAKAAQNKTIGLALFYGRQRYVSILNKYLLRNLKSRGGVVDFIHIVKFIREAKEPVEALLAQLIAAAAPGEIRVTPFCKKRFGCAFTEVLTDPQAVYLKLDDDILFVKDGSFEHMAYQKLTNKDFVLYSGNVVNHPHTGRALHSVLGAFPGATEHHAQHYRKTTPPFVTDDEFLALYWGPGGLYAPWGSQEHEAFIWRASAGQLDVYRFGLFDFNSFRCAWPQLDLGWCDPSGYYRWTVNAFAYTLEDMQRMESGIPEFDEPYIGIDVPRKVPNGRTAVVGDSLFVHGMFTRQRADKNRMALRESVLLPWYMELANQYTATGFDQWRGNSSLHDLYRDSITVPLN